MKIRFFGFEIEFREATPEERKEIAEKDFRKKWGIPEPKPEQKGAK